jgi:hypothetical protein
MKKILLLLLLCTMAENLSAIVVQDYTVAANPPAGDWDLDWNYVYNYKKSSSVAIGEYWILTAAHVADDNSSILNFSNIVVNGTVYYPQEIILHAAADDPDHSNNTDLALVRFDKPFPGWYPLYAGEFPTRPSSSKLNAALVGYGVTGTVSSAYYTPAPYNDPSSGIKRWGSQQIDGDMTFSYPSDGPAGYFTNAIGFKMDFDLTNTDYEAGVAAYDSGGGAFVQDGATWTLAGINTTILKSSLLTPSGSADRIFAVSVPAYTNWITQTMDEITGDDDSDGIPNWWEEQFGTNVVAGSDQDGDGFSGEEEYIADTDPTDGSSFFEMTGTITAAEQTFMFDGSTARQYQLLYTTNDLVVTGSSWLTNGVPVWGAGTGTEITVTNTEDMVFYRMEAILP